MKRNTQPLLLVVSLFLVHSFQPSMMRAEGTAFTYQGRLNDTAGPANGTYDLRIRLAADPLGNDYIGAPFITNALAVSGGLFTVTLDFGAGVFTGSNYWLQVDVKTNNAGSYTTLTPPQRITPSPYAIFANTSSNVAGVILNSSLPANPTFSGAVNAALFSGGGAGLTNLNASQLSGSVPSAALTHAWRIAGNSGTTAGTHFVGTIDTQPLELRVNALRALRLERDTNATFGYVVPNVIAGYESNTVARGAAGVTIAGGGGPEWFGPTVPHHVSGAYGAIGGGVGNVVDGAVGVIAGGERGFVSSNAYNAFVGGGAYNSVDSGDSVIGGGRGNVVAFNAFSGVIGGGSYNTIGTNSVNSTIAGGYLNVISANAFNAVIPGGYGNQVGPNTSYAFAAGNLARANHSGTFVWSDSAGGFTSTGNNQFLIRAAGGVGIGTATPGAQLEVRTTSVSGNAIRFGYASAGGGGNLIAGLSRVSIATDNMVERLCILQNSGNVGIGLTGPAYQLQLSVDSAGKPNGGSWANSSDVRIKQNVAPLTNALERLRQMRGVTFEWRNPEDHANQHGRQGGFIAQEVEEVFPNWISEVDAAERDRKLTANGKVKSLTLPFEFDALIVEAVKEQQAQIEERDKEIEALKQRLAAMEQVLARLELGKGPIVSARASQ
ncbi:MAG TPA: tail fiber domain-containing protein [Verrucomicrobiae bacterium]|nr:tail fiber domain-containing protein [Verrucomicrobiae bacterium]